MIRISYEDLIVLFSTYFITCEAIEIPQKIIHMSGK
jgi:hypothetical protein